MPQNVNMTRTMVRTVSTYKDPDLGRKVVHIAAGAHHIQLSLDERLELYLHNELHDEHNLPIVTGRECSAASVSCIVSLPLAEVRVSPVPQESEVAGTSLMHR